MKNKKKKGFTLIELVIVIAIIGILAAIAIPKYNASKKSAAITAHKSNVQMLKTAGMTRLNDMQAGSQPDRWDNEETSKGYLEKWPVVPQGLEYNGSYTVTIDRNAGNVVVTPDEKYFDGK